MKVLVATAQGQGLDPGDYCWTAEGELVRLVDCPDRYCRCSGFGGVESHRVTTTALVVDRPDLNPEVMLYLFRRDWENQGFGAAYDSEEEWRDALEAELAELTGMLDRLEPGTVVERRGAGIRVRTRPAA
ncbi:MAG: hypothetical protein M5U14_20525 [Acidimicrobiia bacterium]|nr:hypothetical protein [Acidimicrobiia bacterium]